MRRVYRAILYGVTKWWRPKEKKGELLFTCIDASDIAIKLAEIGMRTADVIIERGTLY